MVMQRLADMRIVWLLPIALLLTACSGWDSKQPWDQIDLTLAYNGPEEFNDAGALLVRGIVTNVGTDNAQLNWPFQVQGNVGAGWEILSSGPPNSNLPEVTSLLPGESIAVVSVIQRAVITEELGVTQGSIQIRLVIDPDRVSGDLTPANNTTSVRTVVLPAAPAEKPAPSAAG